MGIPFLLAFTGSCLVSALAFSFYYDKPIPINYHVANGVWLWTSASVDVFILATLWFTLRKHIVGFNESTDSSLRAIIRVALRLALYSRFSRCHTCRLFFS